MNRKAICFILQMSSADALEWHDQFAVYFKTVDSGDLHSNVAHLDRWWLLYRSLLCDAEANGAADRSQLPKCNQSAKV